MDPVQIALNVWAAMAIVVYIKFFLFSVMVALLSEEKGIRSSLAAKTIFCFVWPIWIMPEWWRHRHNSDPIIEFGAKTFLFFVITSPIVIALHFR